MRISSRILKKQLENYGIKSIATVEGIISIEYGNATFDLVADKDDCFGFFTSNVVISITTKYCTLKIDIHNKKSHRLIK